VTGAIAALGDTLFHATSLAQSLQEDCSGSPTRGHDCGALVPPLPWLSGPFSSCWHSVQTVTDSKRDSYSWTWDRCEASTGGGCEPDAFPIPLVKEQLLYRTSEHGMRSKVAGSKDACGNTAVERIYTGDNGLPLANRLALGTARLTCFRHAVVPRRWNVTPCQSVGRCQTVGISASALASEAIRG
jgi:hypothetical protein